MPQDELRIGRYFGGPKVELALGAMDTMTRDSIIQKLGEMGIRCQCVDHEPLMTCDAQTKSLDGLDATVAKTLLFKDKKNRLFMVVTLGSYAVNLKVLSYRLGTGAAALRMAPTEFVRAALQVLPGALTPLSLAHKSAEGVALILDRRLRGCPKLFLHPLVNTSTLLMPASDLETFLRHIGREPEQLYVDLEACPKFAPGQLPDLKFVTDAAKAMPKEAVEPFLEAGAQDDAETDASIKAAPKKEKKAANAQAAKAADAAPLSTYVDVRTTSARVMELFAQEGALGSLSGSAALRVERDLETALHALQNAAYGRGHAAARRAAAAQLRGEYNTIAR